MARQMQPSMETRFLERAEPPFPTGFDGLILYQDVGTGLRAKQALDLVRGRLGPDAQLGWCLKLWTLELLEEPEQLADDLSR